jgi:putative transposase
MHVHRRVSVIPRSIALEMAVGNRERTGVQLDGLIHHSDRGGAIPLDPLLRAARREPDRRVGRLQGDSYDNGLAESFNGLYKWELIYRRGPWRSLDDVEFATLGYVDWFNHRRLHGEIAEHGYATLAEFEAAYCRHNDPVAETATQ